MTDTNLFAAAVECAHSIAYWRQRAVEAGQRQGVPAGPHSLTRRQCLARVRYAQARVIDLAIAAESVCRRERQASGRHGDPAR